MSGLSLQPTASCLIIDRHDEIRLAALLPAQSAR
jgi:hypothetical protein